MDDTFNLEHQYQLFLKRVKLSESNMHPQQKIQLKQAFMGACGQIFLMLRDDLAELEEKKAVDTLEDMEKQVVKFWQQEVENFKKQQ